MDFSEALHALKRGERIRRAEWEHEGKWIAMEKASTKSGIMSLPYVYMKTGQGYLIPWLPDHVDLLAEDWQLMPGMRKRLTMYDPHFQT
ncbi:MAG: DUF2829 domain-containing protein [Gammaproteobacteria bacterium]|nr:DUF2829 domain-containing protein [Gammaproteobacteria bacterium]